jgi:hemerythrin-like metal-binding protein
MSIMPWSDMLSVGVRAIDQQHQTLVGILNDLGDVVLGRDDAWDESVVLSKLLAYTENHFAFEEGLMRRIGYVAQDAHEQEHRALFQQVGDLMARAADGQHADPQELLMLLRDWLSSHIMGTDRALGQALNQRDIR